MEEDLRNILPVIIPFKPLTEGDTKSIASISEQEIWKKATGQDRIPLRVGKKAKEVCIPVLAFVFSHTFLLCSWQTEWTTE